MAEDRRPDKTDDSRTEEQKLDDYRKMQEVAEFFGGGFELDLETGEARVLLPWTRGDLDDLAKGKIEDLPRRW